ncbi:predicted protein [Uncinocarpus reesii 1704]|uniref:Uncharacterized protein n=1 Tax=Uncinocarpus reesii (strain UAMH 1704) TaxID=336963 RepID=C4JNH0_UNCRE|nr:uncharacterized protein UREG_02968 [Uncinocarpus reesii 1704]EEP78123.1 predicted protein [Uncinocarpus reesii 1704]
MRVPGGLAVGTLGGRAIFAFQDSIAKAISGREELTCSSYYNSTYVESPDGDNSVDWNPVTGILHSSLFAPCETSLIFIGILSINNGVDDGALIRVVGLSSSIDCYRLLSEAHDQERVIEPVKDSCSAELRKGIESSRSRFDLDHDLGGMSTARGWGAASFGTWLAVCFTVHPTDMPEHITPSHERLGIVFSPSAGESRHQAKPGANPTTQDVDDFQDDAMRMQQKVLHYIFEESHRAFANDRWLKKLLYAACCCVVVRFRRESELLTRAASALRWLQECTGLNFGEEILLLEDVQLSSEEGVLHPSITVRPTEILHAVGQDIFELCEICDAGIDWYSAEESQCLGGHTFGKIPNSTWMIEARHNANYWCSLFFQCAVACHSCQFRTHLLQVVALGVGGSISTARA